MATLRRASPTRRAARCVPRSGRAAITPAGRGPRQRKQTRPQRRDPIVHPTPRRDDLGATPQARLQYRRGDLCALRRPRKGHRLHRRPRRDQQDAGPSARPGTESSRPTALGPASASTTVTPCPGANGYCAELKATNRKDAADQKALARRRLCPCAKRDENSLGMPRPHLVSDQNQSGEEQFFRKTRQKLHENRHGFPSTGLSCCLYVDGDLEDARVQRGLARRRAAAGCLGGHHTSPRAATNPGPATPAYLESRSSSG